MLNFFACRRDPRLAIRQHHSPLSDGCNGQGSAFAKPSIYFIECCREGQPEPPGSTGCSMASTFQTTQAWTFLWSVWTTYWEITL